MGFLKALLYSFWPNAEGVREAMRISYAKHLRLAEAGSVPLPEGNSAHEVALYGSLASRYRALGQVWTEVELWADVAPFLQMDESEGVEALAEYAALKECPEGARLSWLKDAINRAIRKVAGNENESLLVAALFMKQRIQWWNLLDEPERLLVERLHEKMSAREDDEQFGKEAEALFRKARYPQALDKYFAMLRNHGFTMQLAGTWLDDSRGKFERWEFLGGSSARRINIIVRFWHDVRSLDWQGILYSGEEIEQQSSGQTLEQLQHQLEGWTTG